MCWSAAATWNDPAAASDRRRVDLSVTERGQAVLDALVRGVEAVDARLRERLTPEQVTGMRAGLAALIDIKQEAAAKGMGAPRPARQLRRFSPIFPVSNLAAALEHYRALGFDVSAYAAGDEYGFARRDGVELHLAARESHPRVRGGATYLVRARRRCAI